MQRTMIYLWHNLKKVLQLLLRFKKCNKNMADRFIEQSKEIANNFIQNIVFIDDKAYKTDITNNAFSALDVSNVFAQSGKICAIYAPKSISDVNSYNTILNKADVIILDWYLDIKKRRTKLKIPMQMQIMTIRAESLH